LTMVMGMATNLRSSERLCNFCNMQATCRYQKQYA
jgi:hypothetical protein